MLVSGFYLGIIRSDEAIHRDETIQEMKRVSHKKQLTPQPIQTA